MKPKAKRRRPSEAQRQAKARPTAVPAPQPDLNAENPAVFDESRRGTRTNESVEDPLRDWPEGPGEADEWLVERAGRDAPQDDST